MASSSTGSPDRSRPETPRTDTPRTDASRTDASRTDRPRTDPLTLEVVDLIGTIVARYHEEYEQAAAQYSLTGAQARVLRLLTLQPLPMRRIATSLRCEPSNVTGIVDRLESRGLVERRPDPADRRVKVAAATDEGRATARRLRDALDFANEPLAALSEEERTALRDLLRRMLGEPGSEPAPDPA
ncbi:MarR family winged helix-turn-helix transcriptional regulator [Streptomyces sp. NPDC093546]|uniref:MarR family winged helix-turn-helix transcriptional regulator n=1 Tax=Streptomyces sp. NPDC093546 TaxID=3366040 RepID=UPI0037F55F48